MVRYHINDGVAVIALDNPPVNALGISLRLQLFEEFGHALNNPEVVAIVITGAGRGFSGGGDINEFDTPALAQAPTLMTVFNQIERSHKPVVAAVHGNALGGGLELALACHARVCHTKTLVGLPEVHLGLVPGAGGTQRLPRLVGAELALNLVVQGKIVPASSLAESGLFDHLTEGSPVEDAIALAHQLSKDVRDGQPLKRTGERSVSLPNAQAFFAFARATVQVQTRGATAPQACVDCLEYSVTLPFQQALEKEFSTFWRLQGTHEFNALRHAFLAEKKCLEIENIDSAALPKEINDVVVVGAGTMGSGIAMSLANAGLQVTLVEREQSALDRGLTSISSTYESSLKKGRLSVDQIAKRKSLIKGSTNFDAVASADAVIEAVFEDINVKREVFNAVGKFARPGTLLATNTSMLDVDEIAQSCSEIENFLGLHFFSPAHVMKLLEIVKGEKTSSQSLATAMSLARRLGKTAVVSGVCEGFIGNRMLQPYLMQAGLLLDEGALPHQVDAAIEKWGFAMGPFRVSDMAGNDLGAKIRHDRLGKNPNLVYSRTFDAIVEMGRVGQKCGRGWYDYVPGQRAPQVSQEVTDAVLAESQRLGLQRRKISDEEIVDRLLLALVNEGAKILEEGIAQRASDIDVVYLAGYGFPRWRGGPMFSADQRGLKDVVATMQRFARAPIYQNAQVFWRPANLLVSLADKNLTFSAFQKSELS
ncbi:Fatty acid oxidation complex subunit alpha [Pseudomonas fluorescens]|uniref:Fatty acid oxidation complex subunit alpha n=1 Tax=Pseudomonas fluorescens TaxID=294 RepID=A0A5E7HR30_PSEFL|nr:FAD-dependent oxidoreductase [Pseudomonas fluorescens]VVO66734.1 Fatty acid oxidation complex subunit alpha [Pseudomonas fluorescens]